MGLGEIELGKRIIGLLRGSGLRRLKGEEGERAEFKWECHFELKLRLVVI